MREEAPTPTRETPYDLDALQEAYGDVDVHEKTYQVEDVAPYAAERDDDALGGASVIVERESDGAILYVNVRADDARWDVPGGGREPRESIEATAVREVHEEVGLAVAIDDAASAHLLTFDDGTSTVTGLWVRFSATVSDPGALDVQTAELAETTWRTTRPDDVDALLERALDAIGR